MGSNSRALKKVQPSREFYQRSVPSAFLFSSSTSSCSAIPSRIPISVPHIQHSVVLAFCPVEHGKAAPCQDNAGTIAAFSTCTNFPLHTKEQSPTRTHRCTPTRTGHTHTHTHTFIFKGQKPLQGLGLDAFGPWHYKGLTSKNLIKVKAKRKTTNKKKKRWCPGK